MTAPDDAVDLYGLTARQHDEVGRLVIASRTARATVATPPKAADGSQLLRVIAMTEPRYDGQPLTVLACEYDADAADRVTAVYQTGDGLAGNLIITAGGGSVTIAASASQEQLREAVALLLPGYAVTVAPGTWEFDGRFANQLFEIDVVAEQPPTQPPPGFQTFDGGLQVVAESWVIQKTIQSGTPEPLTETIVDALPYTAGSVSAGAAGLCAFDDSVGWIPIAWQCRAISYSGDA